MKGVLEELVAETGGGVGMRRYLSEFRVLHCVTYVLLTQISVVIVRRDNETDCDAVRAG